MIQGLGIVKDYSVDSYKTASTYQRKDNNGVSNDYAKTQAKKDEAVFSYKNEVNEKDGWSQKTNDEVVKEVKDQYQRLQANMVKAMLVSAGVDGGKSGIDFNEIFNAPIPETQKNMSAEDLVKQMPEEWRPEAVAERIVNFATAFYEKSGLSAEDFLAKIKDAIGSGFGAAAKETGNKVTDGVKGVVQMTQNLVAEKLDRWAESVGVKTGNKTEIDVTA